MFSTTYYFVDETIVTMCYSCNLRFYNVDVMVDLLGGLRELEL
jgi:hypothetical protein